MRGYLTLALLLPLLLEEVFEEGVCGGREEEEREEGEEDAAPVVHSKVSSLRLSLQRPSYIRNGGRRETSEEALEARRRRLLTAER